MTSLELATLLIRVFEGCRLRAYQDSGGIWTIGFGHTEGVQEGQTISFKEAQALAQKDLALLLSLVEGKPLLTQAGLLSFGYNAGVGSLKKVLGGADMGEWIHDHKGEVLLGLVARRGLEKALVALGEGNG